MGSESRCRCARAREVVTGFSKPRPQCLGEGRTDGYLMGSVNLSITYAKLYKGVNLTALLRGWGPYYATRIRARLSNKNPLPAPRTLVCIPQTLASP